MTASPTPLPPGDRLTVVPLTIHSGFASPRDQRDLMERPFFSLSKSLRQAPILYRSAGVEVQVYALPEYGMASIWDADILIWAASHLVDAQNRGFEPSRRLRFTPYQLLTQVGRSTGAQDYRRLKAALVRLQSTVIRTNIRHGDHWRRQQFSWINEWDERVTRSGRAEGMEFVLPDWFYRGVIDHNLILKIDPAYFRLTGGIERWLYRVARKHAGHQAGGWLFEAAHLHVKSGSLARLSDFSLDLRGIARRQPLPGYHLQMERVDRREWLRITPGRASTQSVDKHVNGIGRSGANPIGLSGAEVSGDRAQATAATPSPARNSVSLNLESNIDSNSVETWLPVDKKASASVFSKPSSSTLASKMVTERTK
ncbi:replication initiator protein A [Asticcacaulis endophyticus]|uniref:Replication protein A n=1 Tax=Asticcacaulis endophyticus TaxID=1395890 RepID=A0A918UTT1_9CAUL|nr:replication initiator protein A [Asticcacaulis endophyticus]GGZ32589.1 replication protein A [Asticcacaulis endophyticus]